MVSTLVFIPGYQVTTELYNGSRTLVYRAVREIDAQPVVIKLLKNPYPSFSELVQFRNQYTIAKNLNFGGIIQTYSLEPYQNGYALVMEDFGGISLKQDITIKQQSLIEFLHLAISLCDTLDFLIRHRVIHKDIKPANILINTETKQVKLIDFSIASLLPRETQTLISPNILEGTLAYISPEQTGRMNRGIDYRTDFYSLGVTFYELLTVELPFASKDAMELVHCHIAKTAPLIHEIHPQIPAVISKIVSKLMAKNAEDRYQSALGLKYDLEKCYLQLKETGAIEDFAIAQRDVCDRFIIPDKLYGRETEVETLLQAFERVSTGKTEMMLVAGFSGIGKTAVVNEVHKPIVRQRGYFIKGKFDQFNRNIPFSAFVQAFRDLMGQLLTESDAQIQQWKSKILEAVGESGQVIIEVIPELERIIGKQPPAIQLSGNAAENRFNLLFQKFVQIFAIKEHPLVIFLDDLQWADSASLKLMHLLISEGCEGYLLLIGAYRDNEVSAAHPLMLTLAEIFRDTAKINTISLAPLSKYSVNQLVAETLSCSLEIAQPLTQLVYQKTEGNAFFSTQFIKSLYEDGLITFESIGRNWQCDISAVKALALTDNVVEFMALQLQKLPSSTQKVLQLAACIGNQFDLETLAIVCEQSPIETATCLWNALQSGLILPQTEIYKFFIGVDNQGVTTENSEIFVYKFLHDRVQQAAYSLIAEQQRDATHYYIGQLLFEKISPSSREDRIFELVNQLNHGTALITQQTERDELAQLNLIACRKARSATAYQAAREYATVGLSMLAENTWEHQYEMSLSLHELAAEVASLCGEFEAMEQWIEIVIAQAHSLPEKVNVYRVKIQTHVSRHQFAEAMAIAQQILEQMGVTFLVTPTPSDIQQEIQKISDIIGNQDIQDFALLPLMTDAEKIVIVQIATSIMPVAHISGSPLFLLLVFLSVKISLQYGNTSVSPFAYICYSIILCNLIKDVDTGTKFAQLALQVVLKQDFKAIKPDVLLVLAKFVLHRKSHLKETLPLLQEAYTAALEGGNLGFAGYSAYVFCLSSFWCGNPLDTLEQDSRAYCYALAQFNQVTTGDFCRIYWQSILNLLGATDDPTLLSGEALQETEYLPQWLSANNLQGLYFFYLSKLMLCFLFGKIEPARDYAVEGRRYLIAGTATAGMVNEPLFYFYDSLIALSQISQNSDEQSEALERVAQNQTQLQQYWAHYAPMNYQHKVDLVEAEKYRFLGHKTETIDLYDLAIAGAKENGYIQEEALANELAAKFYLNWGKEKVAASYMQEAYYCYAKWGAKAKTDDLEKRYPQLLAPILQSATRSSHKETLTTIQDTVSNSSSSSSNFLDLDTILKISQSFTSEIHLEKLVEQVMQAVVANAGADKGALILNHQGSLAVVCQYLNQQVYPFQIQPLDSCINLPLSIINYVKRTLELTIASVDIPQIFAADAYFIHHSPQSLLCTPILKQGQLIGLLYLENSLTSEAFTSERLEMLNLLCTQAAISLENASLYNTLEQKVIERTRELSQALNDLKATQKKLVEAEKMAALGGLVAGVAHEINTPVGVGITLASTLVEHTNIFQDTIAQGQLKKSVLTSYLDTAAECSNLILTNLQRAGELIQSFKQVAVDQSNLEQRTIVLKSYVEEIITSMTPQLRQAGHNLTVTGDEKIQLYTYPGAIAQLLVNLLTNSLIHAYPDGNPGNLAIHISQVEQNVILTYSDDGCGIPSEALGKIFEPFFTTARSRGGSGLGLHIVYNLVTQKLGGAIDVDSHLGKGTLFTITLPHSL